MFNCVKCVRQSFDKWYPFDPLRRENPVTQSWRRPQREFGNEDSDRIICILSSIVVSIQVKPCDARQYMVAMETKNRQVAYIVALHGWNVLAQPQRALRTRSLET